MLGAEFYAGAHFGEHFRQAGGDAGGQAGGYAGAGFPAEGLAVGGNGDGADFEEFLFEEVDAEQGAGGFVAAFGVAEGLEADGYALLIAAAVEGGDFLGEVGGGEFEAGQEDAGLLPNGLGAADDGAGVVVGPEEDGVLAVFGQLPPGGGYDVAVAVHFLAGDDEGHCAGCFVGSPRAAAVVIPLAAAVKRGGRPVSRDGGGGQAAMPLAEERRGSPAAPIIV